MEIIRHKGMVERVEGECVHVKILQASACSSCQAKMLCASAESKEKMIDVYDLAKSYEVGEEVTVCASTRMGKNAVLLAFGLPLLLVICGLTIGLTVLRWSEPVAVGAIVAVLAVYYLVLWSLRDKIKKGFSFWIEEKESQ